MLDVKLTPAFKAKLDYVLKNAPAQIQPALVDGMRRVGMEIERHVKGSLSGALLKVRTGTLRRAVFSRGEKAGQADAVAVVGVDSGKAAYGKAHEFGGTIKPAKGKFLAIPVGAAMTKGGVGRFSARELMQDPKQFGYTGAFFSKHVLFGKKPGGAAVPLFVLKPSVTIKEKRFVRGAIDAKREWAKTELAKVVAVALKKLFGNAI
jgi:hypothetical protein